MQKVLSHILTSSKIILPEIVLVFLLLIFVTWVTFTKKSENKKRNGKFIFASIIILVFYGFLCQNLSDFSSKINSYSFYSNFLVFDTVSLYFKYLIILSAIISLVHIWAMDYKFDGELYILLLFSVLGMAIMTMARHFMIQFISIEMVSISSYLLVGITKEKKESEAAIKFLIFGATSSAIMLYAISLLYGMTGSLNYVDNSYFLELLKNPQWAVQIVIFLYLGGLLFKISAAPFHIWTPDVYEAAPTPIVSFLSIAPKVAAILLINRFVAALNFDFSMLLGIVICLSFLIGNFSAIWQTNTKRLLAYSSIAHAGFLLMGLLVSGSKDYSALYFYLGAYLTLTMAGFILVDVLKQKVGDFELKSLIGLSKEDLALGLISLIIMLGLVGLPPTIGFTAKILIFSSLWEAYSQKQAMILLIVLVFGILNTGVSIYYYLRIPYFAITKTASNSKRIKEASFIAVALLYAISFAILYFFINPEWILDYSKNIHF